MRANSRYLSYYNDIKKINVIFAYSRKCFTKIRLHIHFIRIIDGHRKKGS